MPRKYSLDYVKSVFLERELTPLFDSYKNNHEKLPFVCSNGHRHQIEFKNLLKGLGCAKCSGVAKYSFEEVIQDFLDVGYTPLFKEYKNRNQFLPYRCDKGHEHQVTFGSFKAGTRCPACAGNKRVSLKEVKQSFIEVGYTPLFTKYKNNHQLLEFICDSGHFHKMTLGSLRNGRRCFICNGNKKYSVKEMQEKFEENNLTPLFKSYVSNLKSLKFKCKNGHEHQISWSNLQKGQGCAKCSVPGVSKAEKEIVDYFKSERFKVEENNRKIIFPYEVDIYFPNQKVAVEYCGLYWHGELRSGNSRNYHYLKRKLCEEKNIRLITVFEDEYLTRPEVVISRIEASLGIAKKKLYARKCIVTLIDKKEARKFLETNHLQGKSNCRVAFGLFFEGNLVGVMTGGALSRSHVGKHDKVFEMKRLCFLPHYLVVGGASKLFKYLLAYAEKEAYNKIRSYQDMRYGNSYNPVYEHLGFKQISETKYTPHYIKKQKRYRNQSLRKTPEERLTGKTEWELRQEQGFDRIWDCGHRTYEYTIKKQ